jgi:hypothetical protein
MESLLAVVQVRRRRDSDRVVRVAGPEAKGRGQARPWREDQILYWAGVSYDRQSAAYQDLLDRAHRALSTDADFVDALRATGSPQLTQRVGRSDPSETILTSWEFCYRLEDLRAGLHASRS